MSKREILNKREILKQIGFSDDYLDRLESYSSESFELPESAVNDRLLSIQTDELTSLRFDSQVENFQTGLKIHS